MNQQHQDLTPEQRREANRIAHLQSRQAANTRRGPKGYASIWWDHARAVATRAEREGAEGLWDDLALTLENWCSRIEQTHQPQPQAGHAP